MFLPTASTEYYENLITLSFTSYSPYVDFSTHMTAAFARKLSEQLLALADIADPQASFAGPYDAHAPQDEVPQGPEEYDEATIASTLAVDPAASLFDELGFWGRGRRPPVPPKGHQTVGQAPTLRVGPERY